MKELFESKFWNDLKDGKGPEVPVTFTTEGLAKFGLTLLIVITFWLTLQYSFRKKLK